MKRIMEKLKYWSQLLMLPIYVLSSLFPRNKNIWVFGSTFGQRFADNPRYLYLFLQDNCYGIKPIWITRNKEIYEELKDKHLKVYLASSLKGVWYSLRARVYIYDNYSKDINFWCSGRAVKFNMWHGIPLKKIQMDNKFDVVRHPKNLGSRIKWSLRRLSDEKPSHYVLTTSNNLRDLFSSAFATNNVVVSYYPRIDALQNKIPNNQTYMLSSELAIQKQMQEQKRQRKKIIMYMPTFRESEKKVFDILDLQSFKLFLKESGIVFYIKLHPKSKNYTKYKEFVDDNFILLDKASDTYSYLRLSDLLITDYSSIYFDYLVTEKPIVFFAYDLEEYLMNSRELYFDYDKVTPGKKVVTMEELITAIRDILLSNKDDYVKKRKNIKKWFFNEVDILGCEQLVRTIVMLTNK